MTHFLKTLAISGAFITVTATSALAQSDTMMAKDTSMEKPVMMKKDMMKTTHDAVSKSGSFAKKTYKVKGDWSITKLNGQTVLRLSDDFKTKSGPDLKLFLSPINADSVTGQTAVTGAVFLGKLQSNTGAQDYVLPADLNLADYQSVLIHCEAFSKLWAAGAL